MPVQAGGGRRTLFLPLCIKFLRTLFRRLCTLVLGQMCVKPWVCVCLQLSSKLCLVLQPCSSQPPCSCCTWLRPAAPPGYKATVIAAIQPPPYLIFKLSVLNNTHTHQRRLFAVLYKHWNTLCTHSCTHRELKRILPS